MGREVRRVAADWTHPKDSRGHHEPLWDGYSTRLAEFARMIEEKGLVETLEHYGGGPLIDEYMPDWPEEERTHYQFYETISEGTPLSPPCASLEELARWLADHPEADPFRGSLTYEEWLRVVKSDWIPSMVARRGHGLESGAGFIARTSRERES